MNIDRILYTEKQEDLHSKRSNGNLNMNKNQKNNRFKTLNDYQIYNNTRKKDSSINDIFQK